MRIRTIKPEFFLHDKLFDAEKETTMPLRIAFAGIWCASDREGRFKWEPRRMGVAILPYDDIDFSRVLDALTTRGFIVKYRVGNEWFGCIPSWKKHQFVNPREAASEIPDVSVSDELDALITRDSRVDDASHKERKGKEGKGREVLLEPPAPKEREQKEDFNELCRIEGSNPATIGAQAGRIGKCLKQIKQSTPDVTPAEIRHRAANYSKHFNGAALTADALAKWWGKCETGFRQEVISESSQAANIRDLELNGA